MGVDEKRLVVASEVVEEFTMVESQEERLSAAAEQEVVVEMAPSTNAPSTRVDETGPFKTATSSITETMRVPFNEPHDIASSSGTVLELSTPSSLMLQC